MELRNWAENIAFRASEIHRPTSLSELQHLVSGASRIHALGSGHSFSHVADSPGDLVALDGMPYEADVDMEAGSVRVGAGVTYARLAPELHRHGFALANLASLAHISIGGSVATAAHGSGDDNQCLAAAVSAIELVTYDGSLVSLERRDPDFPGAVVALGALGVATALTLDLVPAFELRQYVREGLEPGFDPAEIMSDGYSVSLFTDWSSTRAWLKRRTELADGWYGTRPATHQAHPVPGKPAESCTGQLGEPGPWHERLPHFRHDSPPSSAGDELQSEFLLPRRHAAEAITRLRAVRDRLAPVLQISEIRTVAADELWLSPFRGRDSVGIHFTWVRDTAAVLPVIGLVEDVLAPLEPRPHWGKLFTRLPACPEEFRELAERYDPAGKFGNEFLRAYLTEDDR
ncbi:FAD-binding protein [Nonomuraea sp. NPDC050536]|uniref:FAD-binding protein n=1 Tax=Nonomuraea sp. NPDC050536 TaxID=3364366 RepID=UPI0037CC3BCA